MFLYTRDALNDVQAGLIRPSVHCLSSEFNMSWELEDDGTPYAGPQQVCVNTASVKYSRYMSHQVWAITGVRHSQTVTICLVPRQICRAVVRYLKGHGKDYAFDKATWVH